MTPGSDAYGVQFNSLPVCRKSQIIYSTKFCKKLLNLFVKSCCHLFTLFWFCDCWCISHCSSLSVLHILKAFSLCSVAAVLWHCWRQEGHPACKKNWVARYWHGYLSGARCRLAYGPADATVSCFSKIQIGFTFLVPAHLGSPGKRAVKRVCVCVFHSVLWQSLQLSYLDLLAVFRNCWCSSLNLMSTLSQNFTTVWPIWYDSNLNIWVCPYY